MAVQTAHSTERAQLTTTVLIGAMILVVCVIARWVEGSWTAPAAFFPAVWAGLVMAFGLIFPSLDDYYAGSLWILTACLAFMAGSMVARGRVVETGSGRVQDPRARFPFLPPIVLVANVTGLIEIAYLFVRRNANPLSVLDIASLVVANRAGNYGWSELTQKPGEWFAFLILYAGALFGGVLFQLSKVWWERVASIMAILLVALVFALYGSRFGALYGASFWLAAYLATSAWSGESGRDSAKRLLRLGGAAFVLLAGASIGTQVLRTWSTIGDSSWRAIFADGFSFVGAFSIWFRDHGLVWNDLTWGARTFTKLVAPLGIHEAPLTSIDVDFTYSNIYTVFRDVLEDFGVIGSLVFFALIGYLGRWAHVGVRAGRLQLLPVLVLVYTFILTSFATSVFFYTAPTAALALFVVYSLAIAPRAPAPERASLLVESVV